MGLVVTSKKFFSYDWYNSDMGVSYLNGCINDKSVLILDFYIEKTTKYYKRLNFDSATKTITNVNNLDAESFIQIGYLVGETIRFSAGVNDGTYTITSLTDYSITVAESITSAIVESTLVYLTSAITALDYYYNLINDPKGTKQDFISQQDNRFIQKYTVDGLDAGDTSTVSNFTIASQSYDWVTDVLTGSVSQCTIVGLGITNHQQAFRITHTFFQAPLWTKDKYNNFLNRFAPNNYLNDKAPTYTYLINGKYNSKSADIAISFFDNKITSTAAWFNQNNDRTFPEYEFNTIEYVNNADSSILTEIDITKTVNIVLKVTSASGKFTNSSQFILNFIYCSLTPANYQVAKHALRQNAINDRAIVTHAGGSVNGEFYGSAYQVLSGVTVTIVDANNATINFTTTFTSQGKAAFASVAESDRNYAITVACQDVEITSSEAIDRTNVLCDFNNAYYDFNDATLLNLVDNFKIFNYPDFGTTPSNNVKGREGDLFYADLPFQTKNGIIQNASMQIVATKSGKQDFILEGTTFNVGQGCNFDSKQQINASQNRNYKTFKNNPYNVISLTNDSAYDAIEPNKTGYVFHYPFVLRYEDWLPILNATPNTPISCPDIQNDVKNLTNKWKDIQNADWALKLRFSANVMGGDGNVTPFQAETDITIVSRSAAPDSGATFLPQQILLLDENNNVINSLVKGGVTKVVALFKGDFTDVSTNTDLLNGSLTADLEDNSGGVNGRRIANTNIPSEPDSPWSPTPYNPNASSSWSVGNVTMNLFKDAAGNPTSASVEGFYTDNSKNFLTPLTNQLGCDQVLPHIVLGSGVVFVPPNVSGDGRQWNDGDQHLWNDTSPATWN